LFRRLLYTCLCLVCLLAVSSACQKATPPIPVPEAGEGAITGQVLGLSGRWKEGPFTIYAAPYVGGEDGEGFYVLEPALHPHDELKANGYFQLNDVTPGQYVLVVGPTPEEAIRVVDDQQKPRVFTITAGQVLEAGKIQLEP